MGVANGSRVGVLQSGAGHARAMEPARPPAVFPPPALPAAVRPAGLRRRAEVSWRDSRTPWSAEDTYSVA